MYTCIPTVTLAGAVALRLLRVWHYGIRIHVSQASVDLDIPAHLGLGRLLGRMGAYRGGSCSCER